MESKPSNQEPMSQMNPTMGQMPMNNLPNYQYYIPDYHTMPNYPQMALYANRQQMNGYQYQMEQPREEQVYPQSPVQKAQSNQRISSSNQPTTEKQKIKPYINLLITTVNNLFKENKISLKYLNEKTEHKSNHLSINTNNSAGNSNNRKISETSSLNNTNSTKKAPSHKKPPNANMGYQSHIGEQNHQKNQKNDRCENCQDNFISSKDKYKAKIRGHKFQEKNLCESCFKALEKGNFCFYCNSIYRDGVTDTLKWVECDYCGGWEHFNCEIQKGKKYASVEELDEEKHYMCPICVIKKNNQKNIDSKMQKKLINKKRRGDVFDDQKNKKNQRKDLRNLKSEKCSELLEDLELIEKLEK